MERQTSDPLPGESFVEAARRFSNSVIESTPEGVWTVKLPLRNGPSGAMADGVGSTESEAAEKAFARLTEMKRWWNE